MLGHLGAEQLVVLLYLSEFGSILVVNDITKKFIDDLETLLCLLVILYLTEAISELVGPGLNLLNFCGFAK